MYSIIFHLLPCDFIISMLLFNYSDGCENLVPKFDITHFMEIETRSLSAFIGL